MIDGVLHAIGRDDRVGLVPFTGPSQCTLLMRAANTQPS